MPATRDFGGLLGQSSARSDKDGNFTLNSVPPGDYTLQTRSVQVITSPQGDNVMMFRAIVDGRRRRAESGSMPLSVARRGRVAASW